jgi:Uma2 family endonuclease
LSTKEITYISVMPKNVTRAEFRQPVVLNSRASVEVYNALMGVEVIPKITFEEFRQFPIDGKRYELVRGEVHVTPSPATRHQAIVQNLAMILGPHVIKNNLGEVYTAPLDVRLGRDTALQPDLIFISNARAAIILENWIEGAPDLVVEVSSPSTSTYDRATKLPIYAESGVSEYWLIDSQAKTVEVLKLQGKKYLVDAFLAGDQTLSSDLFPGWQLPLRDLFDFRGRF